jgi:hypothetical protein
VLWLLGEPEDDDVLWLAAALQRRGEPVEVVLPEELMTGSALSYRIESRGAFSCVRLRDGRVLTSDSPSLVVNRLGTLPAVAGASSPADTAYLAEEWRAVLAAWLRTMLCPVINPPRAATLGGPVMAPPVWRALAAAHGVPSRPWRSRAVEVRTEAVEVLCLGSRCLDPTGTVPETVAASLARMARFAGVPLLGATFERDGDEWTLAGATAMPRLKPFGAELVDAVIDCAHGKQVPP